MRFCILLLIVFGFMLVSLVFNIVIHEIGHCVELKRHKKKEIILLLLPLPFKRTIYIRSKKILLASSSMAGISCCGGMVPQHGFYSFEDNQIKKIAFAGVKTVFITIFFETLLLFIFLKKLSIYRNSELILTVVIFYALLFYRMTFSFTGGKRGMKEQTSDCAIIKNPNVARKDSDFTYEKIVEKLNIIEKST